MRYSRDWLHPQRNMTAGATSFGCIHGMPMTELGAAAAIASCSVGFSGASGDESRLTVEAEVHMWSLVTNVV
jgi:hypothetical protein